MGFIHIHTHEFTDLPYKINKIILCLEKTEVKLQNVLITKIDLSVFKILKYFEIFEIKGTKIQVQREFGRF